MPTATLDRTDCRILELLQRDGRLTNVDLAAKVALSPSPCLRRARALEEGGVIRESEVIACYSMTGDTDYLLRVHVEDLEHYSRFMMNRLLKQTGVIDVRSNFVLERIKDTTTLPVAHLG